jgi:hypothetical protein
LNFILSRLVPPKPIYYRKQSNNPDETQWVICENDFTNKFLVSFSHEANASKRKQTQANAMITSWTQSKQTKCITMISTTRTYVVLMDYQITLITFRVDKSVLEERKDCLSILYFLGIGNYFLP